jgi:hypothetical protein
MYAGMENMNDDKYTSQQCLELDQGGLLAVWFWSQKKAQKALFSLFVLFETKLGPIYCSPKLWDILYHV